MSCTVGNIFTSVQAPCYCFGVQGESAASLYREGCTQHACMHTDSLLCSTSAAVALLPGRQVARHPGGAGIRGRPSGRQHPQFCPARAILLDSGSLAALLRTTPSPEFAPPKPGTSPNSQGAAAALHASAVSGRVCSAPALAILPMRLSMLPARWQR